MPRATVVAWRRADQAEGHSLGRLEPLAADAGWQADGHELLVAPEGALACWFRVRLDAGWRTVAVEVAALDARGRRGVELRADDERRWWRDGERAPELDGCVDVDVAATPLTNTFPIRRLAGLAIGEAHTAPVAWVAVPGLGVRRVEQTYRRLGPVEGDPRGHEAWEYGDPLHGSFRLTVDAEGLVVDYEGFAVRI